MQLPATHFESPLCRYIFALQGGNVAEAVVLSWLVAAGKLVFQEFLGSTV